MNNNEYIGTIRSGLYEERFRELFGKLMAWRLDPFYRKQKKGKILPFVRGLRFSALLIYEIRKILNSTDLTANWGHLLDESGNWCSRECDIIIHRNGYTGRWNGEDEDNKNVMDFWFIEKCNAVAVISCKSFLETSKIDSEYCNLMKPYVNKIWLFAECCGPKSVENINNKAIELGYEKFWYLYPWTKNISSPKPNFQGWFEFISELETLID